MDKETFDKVRAEAALARAASAQKILDLQETNPEAWDELVEQMFEQYKARL